MTLSRDHARPLAGALTVAALALSACGSAAARPPRAAVTHQQAGSAVHPQGGNRASHPALANGSCPPPPPRYAWAAQVTTAGRMLWQTPLPTRNVITSPVVQPVQAGQVALFAQDGIVHGVRLTDGRLLWSWTGGQSVYGMWRWQHLVVVLTDQVSDHSRLTGLDAATGAVRWTLRLPAKGLLGGQAATGDGGLAMVAAGGLLQVVSLADGTVRWRRAVAASPGLTASGNLVIFGESGHLTGYDDRTGRPAWTASGLPGDPAIQLAGGLVLVTSNVQGPGQPTALTAVVPATGRIAWRFDPGQPVTVVSAGPAGLVAEVYYDRQMYLLSPGTGRPRWQAGTYLAQDIVSLVTRTAVISVEGAEGQQPVRLVSRDAADGRVVWQDTLTGAPVGSQLIAQAGGLVVLQGEPSRPHDRAPLRAYQLASGRPAWQASLPTFVPVWPVPVPGGFLVQPADSMYACPVAARDRAGAGKTTRGPA